MRRYRRVKDSTEDLIERLYNAQEMLNEVSSRLKKELRATEDSDAYSELDTALYFVKEAMHNVTNAEDTLREVGEEFGI